MGRIKRGLLALFVVLLSFVAVEATPALAAARVDVEQRLNGIQSTGAQYCIFRGTGIAGGAGRMGLSTSFTGCSYAQANFTCVRLKHGTSLIRQVCLPSTRQTYNSSGLTYGPCTPGWTYWIEVYFFHGAASFEAHSSSSLYCNKYA